MIAKIRLTHSVDVFVKGDNEDQIMEWAIQHTPSEAIEDAAKNGKMIAEDWNEELVCWIDPNAEYDINVSED